MTEHDDRREESRLDLRALDLTDDRGRTDAVIGAALDRVSLGHSRMHFLSRMTVVRRGLAAAAAFLLVLAGGLLLAGRDLSSETDVTELIGQWAQSSHTPTNGELLAAYKGYRQ